MAEADLGRLKRLKNAFFCSFYQIIEVTARIRDCSVKKGQAGKKAKTGLPCSST